MERHLAAEPVIPAYPTPEELYENARLNLPDYADQWFAKQSAARENFERSVNRTFQAHIDAAKRAGKAKPDRHAWEAKTAGQVEAARVAAPKKTMRQKLLDDRRAAREYEKLQEFDGLSM